MRRRIALVVLLIGALGLAACGGGRDGLPSAAGRYTLKEKSVSFDGERYSFYWADAAGRLRRANTSDVKLRLDDQNALEVTEKKEAILHLKQDEPITVEARDRQGDYGNFWYPFLIGSMLSRGSGPVIVNQAPAEYRDPVYRYPPSDRFDRGETLGGNVTSSSPKPPDYSRLAPVGGTVAGQAGGTGDGNAATNKADTSASGAGQSGGTGGGSAAIEKSGSFRSGDQGYGAKVGSGAGQSSTSRSSSGVPSISTGAGSSGGSSVAPSTGGGASGGSSVAPSSGGSRAPSINTGRRR